MLSSLIYLVSSALLYPVLILLSLLTLWILLQAGALFAEWLERSRLLDPPVDTVVERIREGGVDDFYSHHVRHFYRTLRGLAPHNRELGGAAAEHLLQVRSSRLWKSLDGLQMVIRIGPGLGLIGTLIPMGTGLAALGQGDIGRLSADLVIAFTTTVVGMAEGMLAYCFYTIRRRWVEHDIQNIELITEVIMTVAAGGAADEVPET